MASLKKMSIKSSLSSAGRTNSRDGSITSQRFFESQCVIKISCFWGADDYIIASDWIELYDLITTDYNWTTSNKIIRLGGYLRKHALVWYMQTIRVFPIDQNSWTTYKDMFIRRFNPAIVDRGTSARSESSSSASSSS